MIIMLIAFCFDTKSKALVSKLLFTLIVVIVLQGCSENPFHKKRIMKKKIELPLYLRISSSTEKITQDEQKKNISAVESYQMENGKTYFEELSSSFPSVPQDFRRWEFYRYNGQKYVCYVLRTCLGEPIVFIWSVSEKGGKINFRAENNEAWNLTKIDHGSWSNIEIIRKLPKSERQIIEFFNDRELFYYNDKHFMKDCIKVASSKFNVSENKVKQILSTFNNRIIQRTEGKK